MQMTNCIFARLKTNGHTTNSTLSSAAAHHSERSFLVSARSVHTQVPARPEGERSRMCSITVGVCHISNNGNEERSGFVLTIQQL